jgi:hypothetical protein
MNTTQQKSKNNFSIDWMFHKVTLFAERQKTIKTMIKIGRKIARYFYGP